MDGTDVSFGRINTTVEGCSGSLIIRIGKKDSGDFDVSY